VEAFLIDEWVGDADTIPMADEASVSSARQRAREVASAQGLTTIDGEKLATIASELAFNQLKHARRGQILVQPLTRGLHRGVEIVAADEGAGITDPTRALEGRPKASGSLGSGLAATRELAMEVDFDIRSDEGTCVRARIFEPNAPRRREIGIFGRPYKGEPRSGDHACIFRGDDRLVVGVCDGLGHGSPARTAAGAAMRVFKEHCTSPPRTIIEECHRALGPTRGTVMAVCTLEQGAGTNLELAAVGNITVELVQPRATRRFGATSFVVGSPQRGWRAHVEVEPIAPEETLIMFTDGIASRATIADDLMLLREPPIVIAYELVRRFARDDDDVLVLVAR
jgi:anti-sigma regulatory factor (Ser/Thr protein kinase)